MVTNSTLEIATTIGSFDDTAFDEGKAVASYLARQLARNSNALATKAEPWHCISFNSNTDASASFTGFDAGGFRQIARVSNWTRLTPAFLQPKMPGIRKATAKLVVSGTDPFFVSVTTSQVPNPDVHITTASVSAGSTATVTIDDIPVAAGPMEEITYWCKGKPAGATQTDYRNGSAWANTNISQIRSVEGTTMVISDHMLGDFDAKAGSQFNYASAGTYVCSLLSSSGSSNRVCPDYHDILSVGDDELTLTITPQLSFWAYGLIYRYAHLFATQRISVKCLSMAGKPRTDY